jgi:hypothetical protein
MVVISRRPPDHKNDQNVVLMEGVKPGSGADMQRQPFYLKEVSKGSE